MRGVPVPAVRRTELAGNLVSVFSTLTAASPCLVPLRMTAFWPTTSMRYSPGFSSIFPTDADLLNARSPRAGSQTHGVGWKLGIGVFHSHSSLSLFGAIANDCFLAYHFDAIFSRFQFHIPHRGRLVQGHGIRLRTGYREPQQSERKQQFCLHAG